MSQILDPSIGQKLQDFAQRRRKLIILRGVCAAVAMLLASMMLVALIDSFFLLEDWMRWTLSGLAYLAVVVAEWRACLRLLMHSPDPRRLARLIEHAEPKLREDLLSAVELGEGDAAMDSAQFRQLVQSDVATRMGAVDINGLLPMNLLRRSLAIAGGAVVVLLAALAFTGLQFGTSMLRALLPMANLARVSKVKVTIVEPRPADGVAPQGDSVPVGIEISGQRTSKATLEIFTKTGGRELVAMIPAGLERFNSGIQMGREDVEYRVRAGDAITPYFHLHAAARPHVVIFHKSYRYPEYTGLPAKEVVEETGDLSAIEKSTVSMEIETDQPVREAELRLDAGRKGEKVIALTTLPNGRLACQLQLDQAGIYRVHMVSAATGFDNKFSPEYELRANPDLIPQVELETPTHDLIVPANEIVDLTGTATDDLTVDHVEQQYRVNGGPWTSLPLKTESGPKVKIESHWDLLSQGFKAGDNITTKLVAYDRKPNKGESRPIQITLTAAGFEMNRLEALEEQRKLLQTVNTMRLAGDALEKQSVESREQFARLAESDPQRKAAAAAFAAAITEFAEKQNDATTQLLALLRSSAPGHVTGNFTALGRLISRGGTDAAHFARALVDVAADDPTAPWARDAVREAADAASHAAQRTRMARENCRAYVESEEIDILNENFQAMMRDEEQVAALAQKTGDDPEKWAQLTGRLRVLMAEARTLGQFMTTSAEHAESGNADALRRRGKRIDENCAPLDRLLAANTSGKDLLTAIETLHKSLREMRVSYLDMRRDNAEPPLHSMRDSLQQMQPDFTQFEKLRQDAESTLRNDKLPNDQRRDLAEKRWAGRTAIFKGHGDVEEARADSDTYFVSDVRSLTGALDALRPAALTHIPSPEWEKAVTKINTLDQSFRVLESAHNLQEVVQQLDHLVAAERWEFASLRSRTSNPRDWRYIDARFHALPDELGKTQLADPEMKHAVERAQKILSDAAGEPWRPINEEMVNRFRQDREPAAIPQELQRMAELVRSALEQLRAPIEQARKSLAALAPTLSETATQLAQEAAQLKKESTEDAENAKGKPDIQVRSEAKQELAAQRELDEKLESLKDALRAEAAKQDLLRQEGREQARDADDALAMLHDPPQRAEQALTDATVADRQVEQQDALKAAAGEQQKLADALNEVAQHYATLEKGENVAQTRADLREKESPLGVKEALDRQYASAEELAKLAGMSAEAMLKALEQALPKNPVMQQELSGISQNLVNTATTKLAMASKSENSIAEEVQKLAAKEPTPAPGANQNQSQPNQGQPNAAQQNQGQANQGQPNAGQNQGQPNQGQPNAEQQNQGQANQGQPNAGQQNQGQPNQGQPNAGQQDQGKANQGQPNPGKSDSGQPNQGQPNSGQPNQGQPNQGQPNPGGDKQVAQNSGDSSKNADGQNHGAPNQNGQNQNGSPQNMAQNASGQPSANQSAAPANPQLAQAARQQPTIAMTAASAGQDLQRAGRHEERLQPKAAGVPTPNPSKTPGVGEQLEQLGRAVEDTAENSVPKAQAALNSAQTATQAQAPLNAANADLQRELARLGQSSASAAKQNTPNPGAQAGAPTPAGPQDAAQASDKGSANNNTAAAGQQQGQQGQLGAPGAQQTAQSQNGSAAKGSLGANPSSASTAQNGAEANPSSAAGAPQNGQPAPASGQPPTGAQAASDGSGQPSPQTMTIGPMSMPLSSDDISQMAANASPQEQTWMARTLDALDAVVHSPPNGAGAADGQSTPGSPNAAGKQSGQQAGQQAGQQPPGGQQPAGSQSAQAGKGQGQAGQASGQSSDAMAQAQQAMQAAAQANAAAVRSSRSGSPADQPGSTMASGTQQAFSKGGARANGDPMAHGAMPNLKPAQAGDWGKLPKKVAEQLSQGQRENVSPEYRNQIETYYRVIAERAKKGDQ